MASCRRSAAKPAWLRLSLTPLIKHWWNVTLYVTPRGLTTSMIPYSDRWFEIGNPRLLARALAR